MIGRLRGIITAESPDGELVLDVQGVGYELRMPIGALGRVGAEPDGTRTIHVHTAYKQDGVELYGFSSVAERAVFRALISVPNVGPKTAIGILGSVQMQELAIAIESGDVGRLSKVPGIGKKTAERLIVELKGKLANTANESGAVAVRSPHAGIGERSERIVAALTNMGYRAAEAERAVEALGDRMKSASLAESLREALAHLARR
jgi:holliday junction DNA helicase RuvA